MLAVGLIRALLFDFDGVVVDTEVAVYESWREVYNEHGVDLGLKDWIKAVGTGTSFSPTFDAVTHLEALTGTTVDREAVVERRTRRKWELYEQAGLCPGVRQLLDDARAAGLRTGIVTNNDSDRVRLQLARVDLRHTWDVVVCADGEYSSGKSALYLRALELLAVAPEEAIAFEDSPYGARAAKEAGLFVVAVPNDVTRGAAFAAADVTRQSLVVPLREILAAATPEQA